MTINKSTMGGRSGHRRGITPGQARLVTARFVLRKLLFSFLAQVPHWVYRLVGLNRCPLASRTKGCCAIWRNPVLPVFRQQNIWVCPHRMWRPHGPPSYVPAHRKWALGIDCLSEVVLKTLGKSDLPSERPHAFPSFMEYIFQPYL